MGSLVTSKPRDPVQVKTVSHRSTVLTLGRSVTRSEWSSDTCRHSYMQFMIDRLTFEDDPDNALQDSQGLSKCVTQPAECFLRHDS